MIDPKTWRAICDIYAEHKSASEKFSPFNSAHEGYAILAEEVDELWDEVKKKPSARDKRKMYDEAKQVAAMAIRFMTDVCGDVASHAPACPRSMYGCTDECAIHSCVAGCKP